MTYTVAIKESLNNILKDHLIREDKQEDVCFALYNFSTGKFRSTAVIWEVILPGKKDRNLHGNVSFNPQFLDRVTETALEKESGICFIHSHPFPGWQGMSRDDVEAEEMLAPSIKAVTGLPLVGMTIGNDGTWSARFWVKSAPKTYVRHWCESVRVVGKALQISFNEKLLPSPKNLEEFQRTISAWGEKKQADISRLRVGVVGVGSVGFAVAHSLYRTGIHNITMIDFDRVKRKNLDRLDARRKDIGKLKVKILKKKMIEADLFPPHGIKTIPYSIIESEGLKSALDCDVVFCCVDRPWPRFVLDCLSKANYIPIIDGGIDASPKHNISNLDQARWKSHTVGPDRICMQCLGQYTAEDVALEQSGLLEDSTYITGLPKEHFIHSGENVFAFSQSLASMEMCHFLSLVLSPRRQYYGPKEFDFNSGNIDFDFEDECKEKCGVNAMCGLGDKINCTLISEHPLAEASRLKSM